MIGLDTNVLVRYLVRDDEVQWQLTMQLIQGESRCFIANIVLCELVWVLKGKSYNYGRDNIIEVIQILLQNPYFEFENKSIVYQALELTRRGKADFSDYLIGLTARQYGCEYLASFDQKLRDEPGFHSL